MQALALLAAAATWSAPQTVSAPHTFAGPLFATADRQDNVLAAWGWQDGVGQTAPTGAGAVRVRGGTVSPEQHAPDGLVAARAYGDGRAVELANRQVDTRGRRWRLTVTDGGTRTLATPFILFRPQLSVAPDGSAIVAWVESHGARQVVRAATRTRSGRFSAPFTVSGRGRATAVSGAAGAGGQFLVAFVRNGQLLGRIRPSGGHWGAARELSRAQGKTHWQLIAAADGGVGELVWIRHRFTSPGRPGARELFGVEFEDTWGSVQRLERDGAGGPGLYPDTDGFVLAYAFGPNSAAVARVRFLSRHGFGPPLDAAAPQGGLRSVSVAAAAPGPLVVGWVIPNPSGDGAGIGYAAALDPNATAFGPREQVTPNEATFDMRLVRSTGQVRALWTARPEGTGPSVPLSKIHSLVRTAVRAE